MLVPIGGLGVRRPTPTAAEEYSWIPWRIMAENMPEIRGAALVSQDPAKIDISNVEIEQTDWAAQREGGRFETLKEMFGIMS